MNDDDISIVIQDRHFSDYGFIMKNEELKEIYDKVCQIDINGLEMLTEHRYEVAIKLDYPMMRRQELAIISNDEENHI